MLEASFGTLSQCSDTFATGCKHEDGRMIIQVAFWIVVFFACVKLVNVGMELQQQQQKALFSMGDAAINTFIAYALWTVWP
jgi:hypothetical protein